MRPSLVTQRAIGLATLLAVGLTTGCDPAPDPAPPTPTTTTQGPATLDREGPGPVVTDPIIPPPLERGTPEQLARLDSGLLTDVELTRLGMLPPVGYPVDSFLVPQRCGKTPVSLGPNGFAVPVRTLESKGSRDKPVSLRQDVASVPRQDAARVVAAVADTSCETYPNMYGRYLHDYGPVDLGQLPGADASVAFCWGSVPERHDVGAMCVLLLQHDDLLVQLSIVTGLANGTRLLPKIARVVAQRLAAVTDR